ncbi:MAG: DnaJ C-terminal domain-containing protein, partial [Methanocorpusculum sp.]|nr:DnaJ C-terminal domain-containing protein [Methanocorpusculum sp.]
EGYGEAGDYGARNGDLYIEVYVVSNPKFDREDDNLITQYEISPAQAVLGCEVEIETIDKKKVVLKIPAGIAYGTRLRIAGEGVRRRGNYGNLLVRVVISVPKKISSAEKELYEKLLKAEGNAGSSSSKDEEKEGRKKRGIFK